MEQQAAERFMRHVLYKEGEFIDLPDVNDPYLECACDILARVIYNKVPCSEEDRVDASIWQYTLASMEAITPWNLAGMDNRLTQLLDNGLWGFASTSIKTATFIEEIRKYVNEAVERQ